MFLNVPKFPQNFLFTLETYIIKTTEPIYHYYTVSEYKSHDLSPDIFGSTLQFSKELHTLFVCFPQQIGINKHKIKYF